MNIANIVLARTSDLYHVRVAGYPRPQATFGTFSVLTGRGDGDSLDFNYEGKCWTKSSQDGSSTWFCDGPMNQDDLPILLREFGLMHVTDARLSDLEIVRYLSYRELIAIRRTFEKQTGAPRHEVINSCAGVHVPVEMMYDVLHI